MPSKLKFKGDKAKKRHRHGEDGDGDDIDRAGSKRKRHDAEGAGAGADDSDAAWVLPERVEEIRGPVFIFHPSDPTPVCVAFDATRGKVALPSLDTARKPKDDDGDGNGGEDSLKEKDKPASALDRSTPTDVSQVWVATRIAGSSTLTLRSGVPASTGTGEPKFLSADKHGLVSADRDARGPEESWTPVLHPDSGGMVALQSVYETYLGVDEVAGGKRALRADAGEVGFSERFWVKVQRRYKREAGEEERKKREGEKKKRVDEAGTK